MPIPTLTRSPLQPQGRAIAGLVFAMLAMIVASGPARSAQTFTIFLQADGARMQSLATVEGLPEPPIEKSSTSLSPGTATGSAYSTGRRTSPPIRIVRSIRKPINKVIDQTFWKTLCEASRSGRPLPVLEIQGLSASGLPTTWRLHGVRIKTYLCPSDPASSASASGGSDVAMEELTMVFEWIEMA